MARMTRQRARPVTGPAPRRSRLCRSAAKDAPGIEHAVLERCGEPAVLLSRPRRVPRAAPADSFPAATSTSSTSGSDGRGPCGRSRIHSWSGMWLGRASAGRHGTHGAERAAAQELRPDPPAGRPGCRGWRHQHDGPAAGPQVSERMLSPGQFRLSLRRDAVLPARIAGELPPAASHGWRTAGGRPPRRLHRNPSASRESPLGRLRSASPREAQRRASDSSLGLAAARQTEGSARAHSASSSSWPQAVAAPRSRTAARVSPVPHAGSSTAPPARARRDPPSDRRAAAGVAIRPDRLGVFRSATRWPAPRPSRRSPQPLPRERARAVRRQPCRLRDVRATAGQGE